MFCNGGTCERSGDGVSYCYLREFEELLSRRSQVRILQGAPFKINHLNASSRFCFSFVGQIWDIIVKNSVNLLCMLGQVIRCQVSIPAYHFD